MKDSYSIIECGQASVRAYDLCKSFDMAVRKYKLTKELHEKLIEQGQITEELMGEMEQENQFLVKRVEDLKGETENVKHSAEKNKETLKRKDLSEKQTIIRQMEGQLEEMKEENQQLAAELKDLMRSHPEEAAAQKEMKETLRIHAALQDKDAQIERLTKIESEREKEIDRSAPIIMELREELKQLEKHLRDIWEEENLTVLKNSQDTVAFPEVDEYDEKDLGFVESVGRCCRYGVVTVPEADKAAGYMLLVFLLFGSILVFLATACSIPDPGCNLWMLTFAHLESYGELSYSNPPVF